VLVAALVEAHPAHAGALAALTSRSKREAAVSTHALAETWATLTRLPFGKPLGPMLVLEMLRRLESRVTVLALGVRSYRAALRRCSTIGLRSGAVFDALHLEAALAWGAKDLQTLNVGDFDRLIPAGEALSISEPRAS